MPRKNSQVSARENRAELASVIRHAIDESVFDVATVADRANINRTHLYHVLKGEKSLSKGRLITLAQVLGRPPSEFLAPAGYSDLEAEAFSLSTLALASLAQFRGKKLRVVTDPRFADSALFLWMMSTQPFRTEGIECEIVWDTYWRDVPEKVSDELDPGTYSIGFCNRRSKKAQVESELFNIAYWTDLCIYRGYALLARAEDVREFMHERGIAHLDPQTYFREPGVTHVSDFIEHCRVAEGKQRDDKCVTLVTMGPDTRWRLCISRDLEVLKHPFLDTKNTRVITRGDANAALKLFQEGTGSFFAGGLPQRLAGVREYGYIEVISYDNNPFLFSINSLICSETTLQDAKILLGAVEALWFQTLRRLYAEELQKLTNVPRLMADADIKVWVDSLTDTHDLTGNQPDNLKKTLHVIKSVARSVLEFLKDININTDHINEQIYFDMFINDRDKYEILPGSPKELLDAYMKIIRDIAELDSPQLRLAMAATETSYGPTFEE